MVPCLDTGNCKDQCITVVHATFGACHRDGLLASVTSTADKLSSLNLCSSNVILLIM